MRSQIRSQEIRSECLVLCLSFLWSVDSHTYIHATFYGPGSAMSICVKYVSRINCPDCAKLFSKMSNLPYFIGESKLVVYATINVHIVASTIVAYATICPARPMPRVGSISRQAGRQKSVRSAKICPVAVRNHDPLPMTVPMHSYAEPGSDHYQLCEISAKLCAFVSNLPHFALRQAWPGIREHPIPSHRQKSVRFRADLSHADGLGILCHAWATKNPAIGI